MKFNLTIIFLTLTFTSCFFNDEESERVMSSTGNFEINSTVNRTDKNSNNYADVIIHLYDKNNTELTEINSGAGDANKWTIGWTESGDTIILQSSDIGNKAWIWQDDIPVEIELTPRLNERAEYLKSKKYK